MIKNLTKFKNLFIHQNIICFGVCQFFCHLIIFLQFLISTTEYSYYAYLSVYGLTIFFIISQKHVPGHKGVDGNEAADRLANEGAMKITQGNHGSTEVTIPCSCTLTNWKGRYPVLSASSHIMFYEFHALWDWANYEPSICNLWSETCIVGLSILWTLNMWSLIRNMLCGIEKIMNQQYVISRQKHDVTNDLSDL